MNRALPSLLALLLVFSVAAVPLAAEAGTTIQTESETQPQEQVSPTDGTGSDLQAIANTTNRLSLEGESRSGYAELGPDLGTMLASADDELRVDQTQYALVDRRFDDATTEERRALLREAYNRTKDQANALKTREEEAVRAHANGELSNTQLLQTLVRNHREAAALSETLGDLEERSDRVPGFSLSVSDEQDTLEMHRTEIRSHLETAARGHGDADGGNIIAIETSESGYALSMIGENYVREATRFDNRDTSRPTQFDDILDAYDHARELYPWAYETVQSPSFNEYTTAQLYLINNNHDQGHLKAYLDGGTGDIYREVQVMEQNSLPEDYGKTWVRNGTSLTVQATQANGPAKVTVVDSATGDPKSATVTIDGVEIGETNADGSLWYVPPNGEYRLKAEMSTEESVNATVSG